MKKFLLLTSAAALCAMSMTAQAAAPQFVKIGKKPVPENLAKSRAAIARAAAPQIWRAAKTTNYYWEITDYATNAGQWSPGETLNFTYNISGQVTSAGNENVKTVYEYDADGNCTSQTMSYFNGMDFNAVQKTEYKYDTVVKNLVTAEESFEYRDGSWVLTDGHRTEITRNADGNVTNVVEKSYNSYNEPAGWKEDASVEIAYGADKKASSIKVSEFDYDTNKMEPTAELVDIVWERTDGQIVFFDTDEADFFLGANRLKSAKGPKATNYPYAGDIYYTITYKANDGGYVMNATMNGAKYASQDYTVVDAYGSFTREDFEIDYDNPEGNGVYVPDGPQLDFYSELYDAYGLKLKSSEISYVDGDKANGISYQDEFSANVTYDPSHGYPLEYIGQRTYDGQAPQYTERIVYSDYFDAYEAGVNDIEIDRNNAPVEYYNLQGVRVETPAPGLYIRRQGNTATKVLVK